MTSEWIKVADATQVGEGETMRVVHAGEDVCLYRIDGKVYATQDTCTHGAASLSDGYIEGDTIECPFHQGLFHIPSGKAASAPCTIDLKIYEVQEEGADVLLRG